jgi:hypothetical protein
MSIVTGKELNLNKKAQIKNMRTGQEWLLNGDGLSAYRIVFNQKGDPRLTGSCIHIVDMLTRQWKQFTLVGKETDSFEIICNKF